MLAFRWIIDEPTDGVTNMAVDEALLQRIGRGESPPTLRFYRWDPPTISLGYFQKYADYEALPKPARDLAVVRRQTGGGAILHDLELTYSLILPLSHPLGAIGGPNGLYHHVHDAFSAMLERLGIDVRPGPAGTGACSHHGPFFCFERHSCFDILAGNGKVDGKIMGSAQRRTAHAVLQHGSLILDRRYDQQQCACVADFVEMDINDHLADLARAIAQSELPDPQPLTANETAVAETLRAKYGGRDWTCKR